MDLVGTECDAGEALAAIDRHMNFGARGMPGEAVPILHPGQRAVDPGAADLQSPAGLDDVGHVQRGADHVVDPFAVLDGNQGAIGPVRHHLHGGLIPPEHGYADDLVAHMGHRRLDLRHDAGFEAAMQAGILGVVCVQMVTHAVVFPPHRAAQTQKGGRLGPPSITLRRMSVFQLSSDRRAGLQARSPVSQPQVLRLAALLGRAGLDLVQLLLVQLGGRGVTGGVAGVVLVVDVLVRVLRVRRHGDRGSGQRGGKGSQQGKLLHGGETPLVGQPGNVSAALELPFVTN
jgi:hypothetical protein